MRQAARGAPSSTVALTEVAPATATSFTSRRSRKPSRWTKRRFSSSTGGSPQPGLEALALRRRARRSSEIGSAKLT